MMRLKRSKSEDRQKLTETEDDQPCCSGLTPDEDSNCAQLEAGLQWMQFYASSDATRPETENAANSVLDVVVMDTYKCRDAASPLATDADHDADKHGNIKKSNCTASLVEDRLRTASEAVRGAFTTPDDTYIRCGDDLTDGVTITVHVADDYEASLPTSPIDDRSRGQCPLIGDRNETQKTKKKNRRQRAKRFAKQVNYNSLSDSVGCRVLRLPQGLT